MSEAVEVHSQLHGDLTLLSLARAVDELSVRSPPNSKSDSGSLVWLSASQSIYYMSLSYSLTPVSPCLSFTGSILNQMAKKMLKYSKRNRGEVSSARQIKELIDVIISFVLKQSSECFWKMRKIT